MMRVFDDFIPIIQQKIDEPFIIRKVERTAVCFQVDVLLHIGISDTVLYKIAA
jgi:hypothetical protein